MSTIHATISRLLAAAAGALTLLVAAPAAWATSPTSVLAGHRAGAAGRRDLPRLRPATGRGRGGAVPRRHRRERNPDTTPGLIGSYAIDNGTTSDVDPEGHGTTWR